ncbi:ABC transporter permease [Halosegnis marinus]|uniref:ABC transporter permease n=1 Tax=Halosegnis marinus TaxID=3034023 RepID=A0ABD5ZS94_9EURY|nr:FtsX-like permease family protein [Halosegnis sp. DT85]
MSRVADLYRRFPTLLIARRNLTRTTARTTLAVLGIVIGVVAIASLGVFGSVLQTAALGSLGDIGNQLVVTPNAEEGVTSLTDRDVRAIERAAADAAVVPLKQTRASVSYGGATVATTVYGISNPADAFEAGSGRIPDPLRGGALVGSGLAGDLDVRAGDSITVANRTYRVRAVLAEQGGFSPLNVGAGVVVPVEQVNVTGYQQVVVQTETGEAANATARAVRESVNDRQERVSIIEFSQITDQIGSFFDTLSLFLIGIGSISLVVAGVSILNVMLMSTIERREEIGVLRAVGYQRRDVIKILLAEATLLGVIGGLAGVVLSVGAGAVIAQFALSDPAMALRPDAAVYYLAGFFFGVVTSAVSGLYPAWKAARERPVDALRS